MHLGSLNLVPTDWCLVGLNWLAHKQVSPRSVLLQRQQPCPNWLVPIWSGWTGLLTSKSALGQYCCRGTPDRCTCEASTRHWFSQPLTVFGCRVCDPHFLSHGFWLMFWVGALLSLFTCLRLVGYNKVIHDPKQPKQNQPIPPITKSCVYEDSSHSPLLLLCSFWFVLFPRICFKIWKMEILPGR